MRGLRGRARLWLTAASLVALAAVTWWLLSAGTRGADISTVFALVVGLAGVVVAGAGERRQRRRGGVAEPLDAARRLAGEVFAQEAAALARLTGDRGDTRPANLTFTEPELVYWRTDGGAEHGTLASVGTYYRRLTRGRLVLLGAAGAGKTVLAVALACDLARTATTNQASGRFTIPIRLSAASFDPAPGDERVEDTTDEQLAERLTAWLIGHLVTAYGVAEDIATRLARDGWLLPVIDGLDEMDQHELGAGRARALLRALDHPTPTGLRRVVLTCRTDVYARLVAQAGGAEDITVVEIEPLSVPDVLAYLALRFPDPGRSGGVEPRWRAVAARLATNRPGDPLVTALCSPLRLFLATTGYRNTGTTPETLTSFTTRADIEAHLFEQFLPAVTAAHPRPSGGRFTSADVERWLTTFARHLHEEGHAGRSASDLRPDQLWRLAGTRPRRQVATVFTTGYVALYALAFLTLLGVVDLWATRDVPTPLRIIGCCALGYAFFFKIGLPVEPFEEPGGLSFRGLRTRPGLRRFRIALGWGVASGVIASLSVELLHRVTGGTASLGPSVAGGVCLGVVFVFVAAVDHQITAIELPHSVVTRGLTQMAGRLVLAGGVFAWLAPEFGLGFGVTFTAALLVANVGRLPWPYYAAACRSLARHDRLPAHPARFLDWAYQAGLMRLSGINVQFRHREFQKWLLARSGTVGAPDWGIAEPATPAAVSALDPDAGAHVLLALAPEAGTLTGARSLAKLLHGEPLALRAAGHALTTSMRTHDELRRALAARSTREPPWTYLLDRLDEATGLATPLVRLLAVLVNAPVPRLLLDERLLSVVTGRAITPADVDGAIAALQAAGFLADADQDGVVLAAQVRAQLEPDARADPTLRATLDTSLRELAAELTRPGQVDFRGVRLLGPHLAVLTGLSNTDPAEVDAACATLTAVAAHLSTVDGLVMELHDSVVTAKERAYGAEHPDTLHALEDLAIALADHAGAEARSAQLHRDILAVRTRTLGDEHPDTLSSRVFVASALLVEGEIEQAEELACQVRAVAEPALGDEHRIVFRCQYLLAMVRRAREELPEATARLRDMLAITDGILSEDDPITLLTRDALAFALAAAGDHQEVVALRRTNLDVRERCLGVDHPESRLDREMLAYALADAGDVPAGVAVVEQLVAINERTLGATHPDTLHSRYQLAEGLVNHGEYRRGAELHQEVLELRTRVLGPQHADTVESLACLAEAVRELGDHERAVALHSQAFGLQELTLAPDDPSLLDVRHRFADTLAAAGEHAPAAAAYHRVFTDAEALFGGKDPRTLAAASGVAVMCLAVREYRDAEVWYRRVSEIEADVHGDEDTRTLDSRYFQALALMGLRDYPAAEAVLRPTLAARERVLGSDHEDTRDTREALASLRVVGWRRWLPTLRKR